MIVVDSNVIAYFYLPGEHTAKAEALLEQDADWAAPLLWRSGFDTAVLCEAFALDPNLTPVTVTALGTIGDPAQLPEVLREREEAPRARRALGDTVIVNA